VEIIDFHVHLPYRYKDPVESAKRLILEMDRAGVDRAILIAVEAGTRTFRKNVSPGEVKKALGEVLDFVSLSRIPLLNKLVYDIEAGLRDHVLLIEEHRRSTREIVAASRAFPNRILPVASYCPDKDVEGTLKDNVLPFRDEIIGLKIYPTPNITCDYMNLLRNLNGQTIGVALGPVF